MTRNTYTTRSELYSPNCSLFITVINILFLREVTCLINATLNRYEWLGISFLLSRTITVNKVISCDLFLITCSLIWMFIEVARVVIVGFSSGAVNLKNILRLFRKSEHAQTTTWTHFRRAFFWHNKVIWRHSKGNLQTCFGVNEDVF